MAERNMVNLTITMTREERKALKQIALDNGSSERKRGYLPFQ